LQRLVYPSALSAATGWRRAGTATAPMGRTRRCAHRRAKLSVERT